MWIRILLHRLPRVEVVLQFNLAISISLLSPVRICQCSSGSLSLSRVFLFGRFLLFLSRARVDGLDGKFDLLPDSETDFPQGGESCGGSPLFRGHSVHTQLVCTLYTHVGLTCYLFPRQPAVNISD